VAICAFCGRDRTLSAEHVFPDWLIKEFPPSDPDAPMRRVLGTVSMDAKDADLRERAEGTAASPSRVNVVCRNQPGDPDGCNTGWMSDLENDTKRLLLDLAHGRSLHITAARQRLLAYWATKTMIMAEYTDPFTRATTPKQRRWIYEHRAPDKRRPLPGSAIFIGSLDEPMLGHLHYRHRALIGTSGPIDPSPRPLAQQTTFAIEHHIIAVVTNAVPGAPLALRFGPFDPYVKQIVASGKVVRYPVDPPLNPSGFELIANAITTAELV
jgi:hypothetical protein